MEPLLTFLALFLLYNLPGILLVWREVPGEGGLALINLLTAWTVLPWLYLLIVGVWPRWRASA